MKGLLVVDTKKCLGCHSCEIGCAVEHSKTKQLFSAVFETPRPQSRVCVEHYGGTNLPMQCRHCEDAPCVKVCPTRAMAKEVAGEAVLIEHSLCIGCKWCILVCPFGAIALGAGEKAVLKCDFCNERAAAGLLPACVNSCPTGALQFASADKFTKEKRREFLVEFFSAS